MANNNLADAKRAKNDEFYTQYSDIEKEINAYLEYDPNIFRGKTVLLPCDDPEWSNFTKYFAQNFDRFGFKKLISTSYAVNSKQYKYGYQATLFEINDPQYDENKTVINGKIFTLTTDRTHDGKIDIKDLEWHYLEGDGDFKSEEIKRLRDEADIIITNPPFSLFREFLAWIIEADKQFVIIGNMNAITYKEVFPLIKNDKMWLGNGFHAGNAYFSTPFANEYAEGIYNPETGLVKFRNVCWFTNLDHGRRHQPLPLMSMIDNLRFSKHKEIKGKESYDKYDNYDAIEVPFTDAIPSDYDGAMGVPISFLDKYSPEQFEIMGITDRDNNSGLKTREYTEEDVTNPGDLNRRGVIRIGSEYKSTYARLLIRRKPKK
ncbi:adenine-specific methyltransferase EcoRI family protein [Methyloglobulus sp.]|uniref:adenine-specific methyltransferase EcoRI family protein n=1 Tax=Methyloglobulus sp. TaxID=2518622 RepID=UPI0032B84320